MSLLPSSQTPTFATSITDDPAADGQPFEHCKYQEEMEAIIRSVLDLDGSYLAVLCISCVKSSKCKTFHASEVCRACVSKWSSAAFGTLICKRSKC